MGMVKIPIMTDENKLIGQVLGLSDLLDYQEGSVVSRTLIKADTGTVTLFSFDKGQGLSEHTAAFDAFIYLIEGKAQVNISGQSHQLNKGQMIIMPANKPHFLQAIERFKMALVMIKS